MIKTEYDALKARNLRMHDLKSIAAMNPDVKMRAAAMFLLRECGEAI
jgi:hypothetical protein